MRILYVSQYFPPEMGAPSARVFELAREWVRGGHEVSVLTGFAHHPTGVKAKGDRWRWTRREEVEGIDVVRSYVYATANKGTVKRMMSYASFMGSAAMIGSVRIKRPDVVIATSPQLLCGVAGYILSKRFRRPFVFEVRDLWPESIMAVDAMKEGRVIGGLKRVANFLYRKSDRIVTVGQGYKRAIEEKYGVEPSHIEVVPNGIDTSLFIPGERNNEVKREFGWGDKTVLMYLGTHGMAHALHVVVEAAQQLKDDKQYHFVFVGEGAEKSRLKAMAGKWGLGNVQFIDQQAKERIPAFYSACDIGLVTLRDTPLFQEVLPSKIFEYLAMERPVLISVGGEARRLVEAANGGVYVEPENADALVGAIRQHAGDRKALEQMGQNGREFVLSNYDRRIQAKAYLEILHRVTSGESHGVAKGEVAQTSGTSDC